MQRSMVPARRVLMRAVALTFTVATVAAAQVVIAPKPGTPQAAAVTPPKLAGAVADGQIANIRTATALPWRMNTTVSIQWDWPGFDGRQADVTIWQATPQGPVLAATVVSAWTQRQASWIVPDKLWPLNQYTVKVASTANPKNSAELPIPIDWTIVTITSPKTGQVMLPGSTQTVAWTFQGKPGQLRFSYLLSAPAQNPNPFRSVPGGQGGVGSFTFTMPGYAPEGRYSFLVEGPGVKTANVFGVFYAKPLRIVDPLANSSKGAGYDEFAGKCSIGVNWNYLDGASVDPSKPNLTAGTSIGLSLLRTGDKLGGPPGSGVAFANLPIGWKGQGMYAFTASKDYVGSYILKIVSEQHPEYRDSIPMTLHCDR